MPATLQLRTTSEVVAAIEAALQAAQWTPPGGSAQSAFETVRRFDSTELVRAFEEILVAQKSRVAFVVAGGERWDDDSSTVSRLRARRRFDVSVLVSDRVLGNRSESIYGNATHPGAASLKDLALVQVTGRLLGAPSPCHAIPGEADLLFVERLEDSGKTLPGRVAYLIDFTVVGGYLTAELGNGPAH